MITRFCRCLLVVVVALAAPALAAPSHEQSVQCAAGSQTLSAERSASLLREIQRAYQDVDSFRARFNQVSFLAALDTSESSGGSVWYRRPGMMKWQYQTPEPQELLLRDQTMWFYQPADRQVMIEGFDQAFTSDLPAAFLLGVGKLDQQFRVARGCEDRGGKALVLFLTPLRATGEQLKIFRLDVDATTKFPLRAEIEDAGGNRTAIHLSEVERGAVLGEENFAAKFPQGIDIQDRRSKR